MAISTMTLVSKYISPVEFTIFSGSPDIERKLYAASGFNLNVIYKSHGWGTILRMIRSYIWNLLKRLINIDMKALRNDEVLRAVFEADVVLVMLGDAFGSDVGGLGGNAVPIGSSFNILPSAYLNKKIIVLPQSTGPINNVITRNIVRYTLNKVKVIVSREQNTADYLRKIRVNKPELHITADIAFIFSPVSPDRLQEICQHEGINKKANKNIVGINVSHLVSKKSKTTQVKEDYMRITAELADYIVENFDTTVLLIPHSIRMSLWSCRPEENDVEAVNEAYQCVRNKDRIIKISNKYTGQEMKGIISQCNIFIGARMHSIVAALSSYIPTTAISYSNKTPGIMKMAGLENYVCDYKTMDFEELKAKVSDMWNHRDKLREAMIPKIDELKESVLLNGKLVKEMLDESRNGGN
ncbi:MAG: polysaccharide pyruvyl transferase family protein [Dehalococcoidales bacterium]|nr:polysaccharide pyruvyl transferase family protein [Dehalococcoidales bacterium]